MDYEKTISVFRGNVEESIHFAAAAVVDSDGKLIQHLGNPDLLTFPRSSLKFIQSIALVETGASDAYQLDQRHLSLACASHMGESIHIDLVNSWLKTLGLDETQLACGPDYPLGKESCQDILKTGSPPRRSFHNCSGKHTGFLTVCKHMGYPVEHYHTLNHPVQKMFVNNLGIMANLDASKLHWSVDGCGFPAPAMRLRDMALAMARFANPDNLSSTKSNAIKSLQNAIAAYPQYMSGTQDIAAQITRATNGRVLVKIGAEGFFIATIAEHNLGIALKVADGSVRGAEFSIVNLLAELNLMDESAIGKLDAQLNPKITNSRGEKVGYISKSPD